MKRGKEMALGRVLVLMPHLFGVLWIGAPLSAQTFVPDGVGETTVAVQVEKPFLEAADGLAFYTTIVEADLLLAVGQGKTVQLGAPLAVAGADSEDGASTYLGNLRVSLLFGPPGELTGYVGLTLPTASEVSDENLLAAFVGIAPWLNEPEKWIEDSFSVRGGWIPSRPLEGGGRLGLRLGGSAAVPTELDNLFLYARAAGWGRFPVGTAELRADLETSYYVNGDDGFGQQFTSYLHLGLQFMETPGRPLAFLRVPLDGDAGRFLDVSVGVGIRF